MGRFPLAGFAVQLPKTFVVTQAPGPCLREVTLALPHHRGQLVLTKVSVGTGSLSSMRLILRQGVAYRRGTLPSVVTGPYAGG
jgi:hypothetical protein